MLENCDKLKSKSQRKVNFCMFVGPKPEMTHVSGVMEDEWVEVVSGAGVWREMVG